MQLLHKFPNVRVIWSTSVAQTCELIKRLKEDRHEPDISKYLK
jgi:ERCC4-type nuclease